MLSIFGKVIFRESELNGSGFDNARRRSSLGIQGPREIGLRHANRLRELAVTDAALSKEPRQLVAVALLRSLRAAGQGRTFALAPAIPLLLDFARIYFGARNPLDRLPPGIDRNPSTLGHKDHRKHLVQVIPARAVVGVSFNRFALKEMPCKRKKLVLRFFLVPLLGCRHPAELKADTSHSPPVKRPADQILDSLAAYCQRINDSGH
jgi:hypothetical protein